MTPIYYEAHVTVEPLMEDHPLRSLYEDYCKCLGFKPAKLLMEKGEPSKKDSFCTGHGKDVEVLQWRMNVLIETLIDIGVKVRRAKIEAVLYDKRLT